MVILDDFWSGLGSILRVAGRGAVGALGTVARGAFPVAGPLISAGQRWL